MNCADCGNWVQVRKTVYGDGTEIVNYTSPAGKGHCGILALDTLPEFGCVSFVLGFHVEITHKPDPPWRYWTMIPCPTCNGGAAADPRCKCAGTGNVRLYDDGHLGDEQRNRHHPKEKLVAAEPDTGTVLTPVEKGTGSLQGGFGL